LGLSSSIRRTFQALFHFFNRFSRLIAFSISSNCSKIDQFVDFVFLRESLDQFQAMFANSANDIVGYANVERAADSACEDVNVVATCSHLPSLEYWVARSRLRQGFAEASPCWLAEALAEAASRAMTA
jgi:hypothetical protein